MIIRYFDSWFVFNIFPDLKDGETYFFAGSYEFPCPLGQGEGVIPVFDG